MSEPEPQQGSTKTKAKSAAAAKPKSPPKESASGAAEANEGTGAPSGPATEAAESNSAKAATAGDLLANQGTSVTVVTGAELRAQNIRHAADALRSLPGVQVNRTGGNGGLTQVRIRGAEGNHTLVIIDGVEANQAADGEFDFSNLATEDIERIEVLRGAQSGLYGSGAIGGVINITTRSGKGPLTVRVRGETGSFHTKDGALSVSVGNDRAWGIAGLHKRVTDGFNIAPSGDEDDGTEISTAFWKGGFRVFDNLTLDGVVRHSKKSGDRDDEDLSLTPGIPVPQFDSKSHFGSDVWIYGANASLALLDGTWVHQFHVEKNDTTNDDLLASPFFAPFELYEKYNATAEKLRYTTTYRLETPALGNVRHFFTGLVEKSDEDFIVYTADNVVHGRKQDSLAGEIKGEYFDHLFVAASVREDDNEAFGKFTTWRTSASLKVPMTPLRLHGSYGTGVKYPALFEQFGRFPPFFVPNPNLIPEESEGWDAGAEVSIFGGRLLLDATRFEGELENKIRSRFPTVVNLAGTSIREGWELTGRAEIVEGLTLSGSYTRLDTREPSGLNELRRPEESGRVDVSYGFDHGRGNVTLSALYNGEMNDEAIDVFFTPIRVTLDDYWVVNAAASYEVAKGVELYGRVENVFDEDYQEVFGFETAGAAAYVGVRLTAEVEETRPWSEGR